MQSFLSSIIIEERLIPLMVKVGWKILTYYLFIDNIKCYSLLSSFQFYKISWKCSEGL